MNLNRLAVFHSAATHLSFTRAADDLCLTQPGISKHIKDLESYYGTPLFDRLGKKVILTQAGEILFSTTTEIFKLTEESKKRIEALAGLDGGNIAIGASITIGTYLLPDLLVKFRQQYPRVEIKVDVARSRQVVRNVLANRLEVGLVGHYDPDDRLSVQTFLADRLVLIVSAQHPWAERESPVRFQELSDQLFLLSTQGSGTWRTVQQVFTQSGIVLKNTLELGTTEGVKRAVAANLGISLLSKHVLACELGSGLIREVPLLTGESSRDLFLVYHRGKYLSAAARAFISLLGVPQADFQPSN